MFPDELYLKTFQCDFFPSESLYNDLKTHNGIKCYSVRNNTKRSYRLKALKPYF